MLGRRRGCQSNAGIFWQKYCVLLKRGYGQQGPAPRGGHSDPGGLCFVVEQPSTGLWVEIQCAGAELAQDLCRVAVTAPSAPTADYRVTCLQADLNLSNTGSPSLRGTINNPDFPADGNAGSEAVAPGRKRSRGARAWRMGIVPWGKRRRDRIASCFPYCVSIRDFGISAGWWEITPPKVAFSGQDTFSPLQQGSPRYCDWPLFAL